MKTIIAFPDINSSQPINQSLPCVNLYNNFNHLF